MNIKMYSGFEIDYLINWLIYLFILILFYVIGIIIVKYNIFLFVYHKLNYKYILL